MAYKKRKEVPIIDFNNFQKENAMMDCPLHMGETIKFEDGSELHLCKRIAAKAFK